jgi:hypothetical protein
MFTFAKFSQLSGHFATRCLHDRGKTWLISYLDSLNEDDRAKVVCLEGHKVFKVGGGTRLKSDGEYESVIFI